MGLGITGLANAGEMLGKPYASDDFMQFMEMVLRNLRDTSYDESAELAKEKGPFPLWSGKTTRRASSSCSCRPRYSTRSTRPASATRI